MQVHFIEKFLIAAICVSYRSDTSAFIALELHFGKSQSTARTAQGGLPTLIVITIDQPMRLVRCSTFVRALNFAKSLPAAQTYCAVIDSKSAEEYALHVNEQWDLHYAVDVEIEASPSRSL